MPDTRTDAAPATPTLVADPHPALRPHVRRYAQLTLDGPAGGGLLRFAAHHRMAVSVIWAGHARVPGFLEDARRIRPLSLNGATTRWLELEAAGEIRAFFVQLRTGGARALFGVGPLGAADRSWPLEDVAATRAGSWLREWEARVADAPSFAARVALTDRTLLARLASRPRGASVVDPVAWAVSRLEATCGALDVGALGSQAGIAERTLRRRFREELGMSVKRCARVVRARRALDLLGSIGAAHPHPGADARREASRRSAATPLARLLATCGYYDQAHLIHEFRELVGVTPAQFDSAETAHDLAVLGDA